MNNHELRPPLTDTDIEEQLRLAAPSPRPQLRERILANCQPEAQSARASIAQEPGARSKGRARRSPAPEAPRSPARLKLRVAGVCALCLLQWLAVSRIDARSEAAIHGSPSASLWAQRAPEPAPARAEHDWPQALQRRALLLGALMNSTDSAALWTGPPVASPSEPI